MNLSVQTGISTRILVYAMTSTIVVAFGSLGALIMGVLAPEGSLLGLLLGSVLGAFLAVHESTIVGCVVGMLLGLCVSPFVYLVVDQETAFMTVFLCSLLGAFLGEPFAHFWREAHVVTDPEAEPEEGR